MGINYEKFYHMQNICLLLFLLFIILVRWNYKKITVKTILVNIFYSIGLIFYQYLILRQQVAIETSYTSIIATLVACTALGIYVFANLAVYVYIARKRNNKSNMSTKRATSH